MGIGYDRLSTGDLINLAVEAPDTPMHMGVLAVLDGGSLCDRDGKLRLAEIRAEVARRLPTVPQLHRVLHRPRPLGGRPLWVEDPGFRIERHVDQVAATPPGDQAALLRLAEDLMAVPLDRDRPLWRMWFVTGLADGRLAVLFALHHAIADGLAAVRLVGSLLDSPADPPTANRDRPAVAPEDHPAVAPEDHPAVAPEKGPGTAAPQWRDLVLDNLRSRVAAGRRLVRLPRPSRLAATVWAAREVLATSWGAPRTSLNVPVGARRRLAVLDLDLGTVKRVAHAHGGRVNDVVLGLAASGLRALLCARNEPVYGMSLRVSVAVSLRTPAEAARSGNQTGTMIVRLPVGEPDPDTRLRLVSASSAAAKRSQLVTVGQGFLVWLARLGLLRRFTRRQHMTNVLESNLIGPPTPIRILGAPVLGLVPIGNLAGNLAMSFLAISYAGRLTVAVRADADQFPDLPVLVDAMRREWDRLVAATAGGTHAS